MKITILFVLIGVSLCHGDIANDDGSMNSGTNCPAPGTGRYATSSECLAMALSTVPSVVSPLSTYLCATYKSESQREDSYDQMTGSIIQLIRCGGCTLDQLREIGISPGESLDAQIEDKQKLDSFVQNYLEQKLRLTRELLQPTCEVMGTLLNFNCLKDLISNLQGTAVGGLKFLCGDDNPDALKFMDFLTQTTCLADQSVNVMENVNNLISAGGIAEVTGLCGSFVGQLKMIMSGLLSPVCSLVDCLYSLDALGSILSLPGVLSAVVQSGGLLRLVDLQKILDMSKILNLANTLSLTSILKLPDILDIFNLPDILNKLGRTLFNIPTLGGMSSGRGGSNLGDDSYSRGGSSNRGGGSYSGGSSSNRGGGSYSGGSSSNRGGGSYTRGGSSNRGGSAYN